MMRVGLTSLLLIPSIFCSPAWAYAQRRIPSTIIDQLSSDDTTVQEGGVVVLVCNVTGLPLPEVTWYRRPIVVSSTADNTEEDESRMCPLQSNGQGIVATGEMLVIRNVSRYCDAIYECVAFNGMPPPATRRIHLTVEFAPEIQLPNRQVAQVVGRDVILRCIITAYPGPLMYWQKDGRRLTSSSKYQLEVFEEDRNTVLFSLRIYDTEQDDYGKYTCVAANILGRHQETMLLYEYRREQQQ